MKMSCQLELTLRRFMPFDERAEDERAEDGADHGAAPAGSDGAADDDGGDDVQLAHQALVARRDAVGARGGDDAGAGRVSTPVMT